MTSLSSLKTRPRSCLDRDIYLQDMRLSQFRNYDQAALACGSDPVVLTGPNGAGKTNLLEAVSLLSPGRGMRRAKLADLTRQGSQTPWAVSATLTRLGETTKIGTGLDPEGAARRVVKVDGEILSPQSELADYLTVSWLTPQMDRLFTDAASTRRGFLDRLAFGYFKTHASLLNAYEHAMRERLRLLKEGVRDETWLTTLEEKMADTGLSLTQNRLTCMNHLLTGFDMADTPFPCANLKLVDKQEEAIDSQPLYQEVNLYRQKLAENRALDGQSGITTFGIHRHDLAVEHRAKKMPANLCSTGEQKALLVAIILANARVLAKMNEVGPILLLDEIAAHLDEERRASLFTEICTFNSQTWMTGTDKDLFLPLLDHATFFEVKSGSIQEL